MGTDVWSTATDLVTRPHQWLGQAFQLVRLIEGQDTCFKVDSKVNFNDHEVTRIQWRDGRWHITTTFMGLLGHKGVLPSSDKTRIAHALRENKRAFVDFLDMFHHRLICLAYRSWMYHRPYLTNNRPAELSQYRGLLQRRPVSRSVVETILCDYFNLPVKGIDFDGPKVPLAEHDMSRLGGDGSNNRLGANLVIGRDVVFRQGSCRIQVGPLSRKELLDLLPSSKKARAFAKLARLMIDPSIVIQCQLVVKKSSVPRLRLGQRSSIKLGLTAWVKSEPFTYDADDLCYFIN